MLELNEVQLGLLATLASVIVIVLRFLAQYRKWRPSKAALTWGVFGVSVILGAVWLEPVLPTVVWPAAPAWSADPAVAAGQFFDLAGAFVAAFVQWVDGFFAVALAVMGAATFIYNTLLEKIAKSFPDALSRLPEHISRMFGNGAG